MSNLINSLDATALALLVWNNKKKIPHNLRWVFFYPYLLYITNIII